MDYFWKQYEDIPAGLGYEHFSAPHLLTLAVIALCLILAMVCFRRLPGGTSAAGAGKLSRDLVFRAIPCLMMGLEIVKVIFLLTQGRFGPGYLPLHLCGLGMFVFLLEGFSRTEKWQTVFSEISVTLILPGAVAALLFPDWTSLYPVLNFMNLYGFVWHGLLLLYPLLLIKAGRVRLSVRHIHYDLIFLVLTAVPVYVFDQIFHCNYMFLIRPPKGSPLAMIADLTGPGWYLAGYFAFAAAVIGLIYLGVFAFEKRNGQKKDQRQFH